MDGAQFQPHSCDWCKRVVFDLRDGYKKSTKALLGLKEQLENGTLGTEPPEESSQRDKENMAERGALFDVTFGEFCTGAAAGCLLFKWIVDDEWISQETIHGHARKHMIIDDPNNQLGWAFRDSSFWVHEWLGEPCPENTLHAIRPDIRDSLDQCRLWASTYQGTGNPLDIEFIQFFGLWDPASQKIVYRTRNGFQAFAQPEDPSSSAVSNRPINMFPGSSTSLTKVSSWLDDCQKHHECGSVPGVMPTRLIEVRGTSDNLSLRLRRTEEVGRVPYAALSYCWGGEQPTKCLSSNVDSYETAIPAKKQPPTIMDAAIVCQAMGLEYLWLDALCIIQDDSNDKSIEIAKMPSIYGGATVTIAAARASAVTEGFLGERFPGPREAAIVPFRCLDGELGNITLAKLGEGFESSDPIDERGWTLQERLLSSRIIEFGSRQTRWICPATRSSGFSLEGVTDGWRRDVKYGSKRQTEALDLEIIRTVKSTLDFYGRPRNSKFREYSKAMKHWEKICETFTERDLTLSSDRAVALSGIAQIFARISGDQYLAGLWKSCFHSGLLWKIQHSHFHPKNLPRPTIYQGPSWSWLSVNGPVDFGQACRPSECVAEILDCETEPADETAPYGLLREGSGRLILAARTVPGVRSKVPLRAPGTFKDELMILGIRKSVVCYAVAEIDCDVEEAEIDEEEAAGCLAVEISRSVNRDKLHCRGLVLRWSSPERKTYSRVGRFSYYGGRKGRLVAGQPREGQSAEVDFDWFTDELQVIEII
ncbi:hypothetical protein DL771_012133 [Monosporascus sp. 5C6A]|nr:hypothetical protein DL771_012133 [Monosporascus sp. 5C6A]